MTLVELRDYLIGPAAPAWAWAFSSDEIFEALRKSKSEHRLDAYVKVPNTMVKEVIARAAVHLNRLDPARLAEGLEHMKSSKASA